MGKQVSVIEVCKTLYVSIPADIRKEMGFRKGINLNQNIVLLLKTENSW